MVGPSIGGPAAARVASSVDDAGPLRDVQGGEVGFGGIAEA